MQKLFIGALLALGLLTLSGCYESTSTADGAATKTTKSKCGAGKCGDAKKETKKCGATMKCGAGKCGSGK